MRYFGTYPPMRARTELRASYEAVPSCARCAMAGKISRPWWAMAWASRAGRIVDAAAVPATTGRQAAG